MVTDKFDMVHGHQYNFQKNIFLNIDFGLVNSADPDEMSHYEAFHLGVECLPKYPIKGFWQRVYFGMAYCS